MFGSFLGRFKVGVSDGFSLVELVVVMGLLSIFAGLGSVSWVQYNTFKRAEYVREAAGSSMELAFGWFWDGDVLTDPVFAGDVWNEGSRDSTRVVVEVVGECVFVSAVNDFGDESLRELCVDPGLVDPATGEVRVLVGNDVSPVLGSDGVVVGGDSLGVV